MSSSGTRQQPRYYFPKAYADFVQRLRVPCGFLLLVTFAWLSHPSVTSTLIGLPVSLAGLGLRAWASGHLAKNQQLAVSGPYSYIRNPLYEGTLIAALGIVIASRDVWLTCIFAGAFLLIYLPAIELEEQHLREIFPDYEEYADHVHRLLPQSRWTSGTRRFSWLLYVKNEEYKAALGWVIAMLWLAWKCWFAVQGGPAGYR